jgi:hypothetical protein
MGRTCIGSTSSDEAVEVQIGFILECTEGHPYDPGRTGVLVRWGSSIPPFDETILESGILLLTGTDHLGKFNLRRDRDRQGSLTVAFDPILTTSTYGHYTPLRSVRIKVDILRQAAETAHWRIYERLHGEYSITVTDSASFAVDLLLYISAFILSWPKVFSSSYKEQDRPSE